MEIQSMPDDILCDVFMALKDAYPPHNAAQRVGWLVVTFIDRRWRSLALTYANLWTDLPVDLGPEWLRLFVSRSRDASLAYDDVGMVSSDKALLAREEACTSILPAHMHRLYKIRMYNPPQHRLQVALSRPAPVLEDLTLFGYIHVDAQLFLGQAPRLRSLALVFYPTQTTLISAFDAQPTVLQGLTSLTLELLHDQVLSVHRITEILLRTPKLEKLSLAISSGPSFTLISDITCHSSTNLAELDSLKTCTLGGRVDIMAHVFSHLRFPPSVTMAMTCNCSALRPQPGPRILLQLAEALTRWRAGYGKHPSAPFVVAHLQGGTERSTTLKFASGRVVEAPYPCSLPSDNVFTLVIKGQGSSSTASLEDPGATIYSDILPTVFSHGEALRFPNSLRHYFGRTLPNLREICYPPYCDQSKLVPSLELLPSLRVMHLIGPTAIGERDDSYEDRHDPNSEASTRRWDRLRSVLRARREAGMPLERIVIHEDISAPVRRRDSDRYDTVKKFMEGVVDIVVYRTTEPFWEEGRTQLPSGIRDRSSRATLISMYRDDDF
ncbi:unnamed protein product [Peniophora sp. CBMAI 1063]|nr:unnamed protein product [Peniophora sp. CBMAI 1063]